MKTVIGKTIEFKTKKEAINSLELFTYHNYGNKNFKVLGLKKLNDEWVVEYQYKVTRG